MGPPDSSRKEILSPVPLTGLEGLRVVSFAGGIPDPQLFDLAPIAEAYDWVLSHQGTRALQYGVSEGELELREQAARRLSRTVPTDASQIRVTSSSS